MAINKKQIAILGNYLKQRIPELKELKGSLENQLAAIDNDITVMEECLKALAQIPHKKITPIAYDPQSSLAKKIIYFLHQGKQLKSGKRLYHNVATKDKSLGLEVDAKTYFANVHSTLTSYCKKGIFFKRTKSEDDDYYLYGLKEWFDEDGNCKEEYLPE